MKKILIAASEAIPFIKTGGLADVVGSLPRYFNKDEYDVRVILPKYALMEKPAVCKLRFECQLYVNLEWRRQYCGILKTEYKGIKYYFVDNEYYFNGDWPYGDVRWDMEKFAFFSKAVLDSIRYLDWAPDIIHCNDWQTALIPVYLKTTFGSDPFYHGIKTVLTIHNMKFQGRYDINSVMDITGLPANIFNSDELESYGVANYLKGGVVYADKITTVSPTYAENIQTPLAGEGLDGLMRKRAKDLVGILNGLDYEEVNPLTNPDIEWPYKNSKAADAKKINKRKLQEICGLPQTDGVFMIGMISRMTDQKGFDLVTTVMEEMLSTMDVQFVLLGSGDSRYENSFRYFQDKYPTKVNAYIGYHDARASQIYAGCDAFLMPSQFEPCGLSQMIAMRYGALPIVRETGGLKDTVEPYNMYEGTGTGFSFKDYNAFDMLHVIRLAADVYYKKPASWNSMVKRAMDKDFSWKVSAGKYEELYDSLFEDLTSVI